MNPEFEALKKKIEAKHARVGVVGLGYVGLPLVKLFLNKGFSVTGFDIDPRKVSLLNQGQSYIRHISAKELQLFLKQKKFKATADFSKLRDVDAVIICVPTPLDAHKNPDLSYVLGTAEVIGKYLRKGQLVSLESTTYPGTTEEELLPILERRGLKAGRDFFLAFSPEREDPGNKQFSTETIPKVVGGLTPDCRRLAGLLYGQVVLKTIIVSSPRVAEAVKLLENIFRSVNIALVNEMKIILELMGIDVWEVIKAASYQALRLHALLSRPRLRRSLHSGRPLLPDLEGEGSRLQHQVHRARGRDQYPDALLRRQQDDRGPERQGPVHPRREGPRPGHRL